MAVTNVIAFFAVWCAVSVLATFGFHVCKCAVRISAHSRRRHHRVGPAIPPLQPRLVADALPSTRRFEQRGLAASVPSPMTRTLR